MALNLSQLEKYLKLVRLVTVITYFLINQVLDLNEGDCTAACIYAFHTLAYNVKREKKLLIFPVHVELYHPIRTSSGRFCKNPDYIHCQHFKDSFFATKSVRGGYSVFKG